MSKRSVNSNSDSNSINRKKVRKAADQSNTLFNYFQSSRTESVKQNVAESNAKQSSILDFIKVEKLTQNNNNNSRRVEALAKCDLKLEDEDKLLANIDLNNYDRVKETAKMKTENEFLDHFKEEVDQEIENSDTKLNKAYRKCPFYKRIEGTKITVDAFNFGSIENCDAYFLSHFHYDHYIGLNKNFKHKLYCSQVTANLVMKKIRVEKQFIYPLEMNTFLSIYAKNDALQVALLDANHCPGSVMFLFKLYENGRYKYILHTGDFRASDELIQNTAMLQNIKLDTVHLDTTYCDSFYKFLPQTRAISLGAEFCFKELSKYPTTLFVCGSYSVGKERVFLAIAEKLSVRAFVTRDKWNTMICYDDEKTKNAITLDPNETNLHILSMGHLNPRDLEDYLAKFPKYSNLIAIKPTGWTHKDTNTLTSASSGLCVEKKSKNTIIYGLEYSEHSSFEELKNFIKAFRPRKIIPTVSVARKENRDKMQAYFQEWLKL